eukprot:Gregarina_sp_Poly_1__4644@NODE_2482_length_2069_cov_118_865135_g1575_i0_p1_GENE_NODE_2482_length_2069_cov_118_865135_g1575_i0NODE_2482_length_2069_cov_118_865135_g1575_i0_p1_ORF_typecomplete_len108_score2_01PPDK_N/PF01326_19/0_05_NODE_2482_length_2069_cov_118_865135_g1575_i014741797
MSSDSPSGNIVSGNILFNILCSRLINQLFIILCLSASQSVRSSKTTKDGANSNMAARMTTLANWPGGYLGCQCAERFRLHLMTGRKAYSGHNTCPPSLLDFFIHLAN